MEYKSLGSLVKFVGGYSFKSEKYVSSGLRIIRITNVQDGILEDNAPCYYPIEYKDMIGNALLKEGDLLMSLTGNVGRVAFITDEFLPAGLNQRVECFRTDDNIIKKYLFYMFKSKTFIQKALKNATGVAQLNMSTTWLKDYMVPIRNSNEMNSIIKTLESIESAILSEKNGILSYDSLIKSRFIEMFGDPISNSKNLKTTEAINVVKLQRGFDLPVSDRNHNGDVPLYGSNGIIDHHDIDKCKKGIITGRSGTLGEVYYSNEPFWPLNTTLFSVDTHGNSIIYLKWLLTFYHLERFGSGSGVPTLNRNAFHQQQIIDVPKEEQNNFEAFANLIDKLKFTFLKRSKIILRLLLI